MPSMPNSISRSTLVEEARVAMDNCSETLPQHASTDAERFVHLACNQGRLTHYKIFPAEAIALADSYAKRNQIIGETFLKYTILYAISATLQRRTDRALPPILAANQEAHFKRLLSGENFSNDWMRLDRDLFHKEFGLASERLYAAGSQLLDPNCGVPRSIVIRAGVRQLPQTLLTIVKLGGFSPYIQLHTHKFNLARFNEPGRREMFRGCVELYSLFPDCLGTVGSSWFLDPALHDISPHLDYLLLMPLAGGAHLFYYSANSEAIANATATSKTRRKLFEEGKYLPKNYMLIWGKQAQTEWARQFED